MLEMLSRQPFGARAFTCLDRLCDLQMFVKRLLHPIRCMDCREAEIQVDLRLDRPIKLQQPGVPTKFKYGTMERRTFFLNFGKIDFALPAKLLLKTAAISPYLCATLTRRAKVCRHSLDSLSHLVEFTDLIDTQTANIDAPTGQNDQKPFIF